MLSASTAITSTSCGSTTESLSLPGQPLDRRSPPSSHRLSSPPSAAPFPSMSSFSWLIEPGFFSTSTVQTALLAGGVVAFTSGVVGLFTVMRRQSFAGEALGDVGATGGSGAFLISINPLWGFVGAALIAAGVIEGIGTRRDAKPRRRDGIVLGAAVLGIAALFLYFDTTHSSTTGASISVLFGSLFVIDTSIIPVIVALSAAVLGLLILLYRPLLLATLSPDLAQARGVRVRLVGVGYLVAMAVAVSLAALTIGAVSPPRCSSGHQRRRSD